MDPFQPPAALSPWEPGVLSLVLYFVLVGIALSALLFLCSWLGEKKPNPEKSRAYECGVVPTGTARVRYPVLFYLVAVFFLIFDVEAAFIFAWAVAFRELGVMGWLRISFFIVVLLVSLFYVWKKGGLDWRPVASRRVTRKASS